jgi:hypothetical protein
VLYQLSYTPQLAPKCSPRGFGRHPRGNLATMTEHSSDQPVESGDLDDEPPASGILQDEQEGKGYGSDEGEREESLE